jgi:hypothetical protein
MATSTHSKAVAISPFVERRGGSGCRYRRIGSKVLGGKTPWPLPFTPAPRPIPLFSVVRTGPGRLAG